MAKSGRKKGSIPWNKGIKTGLIPKSAFKKGYKPWQTGTKGLKPAPSTAFKKGHKNTENWYKKMIGIKPWNKGVRGVMVQLKEELSPSWKGDDVKYTGLHQWVYRNLGQPDTCVLCGKSGLSGQKINWANKDHLYKRNLDDWLRLCVGCHKKYDCR